MPDIKMVGIIAKPNVNAARAVVPGLLAWMEAHAIAVRYDTHTAGYVGRADGLTRAEVPEAIARCATAGIRRW